MTSLAKRPIRRLGKKGTAMPNPSLRVLVAENQYLIAMEVEQILLDALDCTVTIVPLARLEQQLGDGQFDVVLFDSAPIPAVNLDRARRVRESGAAVVILSSYDDVGTEASGIQAFPVVAKPIFADDLIHAVKTVTRASA
jgi:DNA-binding NarL/FixJ family response regulator